MNWHKKQKEDKSLDDLKDITNQALTSGAKSEYELVVDLSRPDNIKNSRRKNRW